MLQRSAPCWGIFFVALPRLQGGIGMEHLLYLAPLLGVAALIFAFVLAQRIEKAEPGNERMQELGQAITEGAMAFLNREYRTLVIFVIVVAVALVFGIGAAQQDYIFGFYTAISFLVGAVFSGMAGNIGMRIATKANTRTANAARTGLNPALDIAFSGGAVMGMAVVGLGLLGVGVLYLIFGDPNIVNGFALGASSIALFARVGGGIYTKAADVGADLVGKVEAGIPEDDPRNPAVIADNVGDNVGDVAGMGADLFESYVASIISSMAIGAGWVAGSGVSLGYIYLPLVTGAVGIIASILAGWIVRQGVDRGPAGALRRGTFAAAILALIGTYLASVWLLPGEGVRAFGAVAAGVVVGVLIGLITEYYTSYDYKPVQGIAQ